MRYKIQCKEIKQSTEFSPKNKMTFQTTYDHFFTNKKEALKKFDDFEMDFYAGCSDKLESIKLIDLRNNKTLKRVK